jgi:hypothetical protein
MTMKKINFLGIVFAIALCALFIVSEVVWAKKPPKPEPPSPPTSIKYGYAMFRDGVGDVIQSDNGDPYVDCHNGGEDVVWISQNGNGSLNWVEFYPGKLYYHYLEDSPSNRSVKFCFNVSAITAQTPPSGETAVLEILRWYKDTGGYVERSTDHPGYLDDGSIHAPIMVHIAGQDGDVVQFVVDTLGDVNSPGTDPKAITQEKVDEYYPDDKSVDYLDTQDLPEPEEEPAKYIIYFLNYGVGGFTVTEVDWVRKKPVTWIISATGNPKLYVKLENWYGNKIYLVEEYPENLPFEFAVSLNPLDTYPTGGISGAPGKDSTLSATWGENKAK